MITEKQFEDFIVKLKEKSEYFSEYSEPFIEVIDELVKDLKDNYSPQNKADLSQRNRSCSSKDNPSYPSQAELINEYETFE